jgi:farnesyl diphosphate synthase
MDAHSETFESRLAGNAREIEAVLDMLLSRDVLDDETARPEHLRAAMHYAVLNGGKRLRPFLVVETAAMLGGDRDVAMRVGAALECVHCYSLVHDDLPAMDDDDLRRGKPTVHIAFDEATAILAGDSLLTYAFDIIAATEGLPEAGKLALILALAGPPASAAWPADRRLISRPKSRRRMRWASSRCRR